MTNSKKNREWIFQADCQIIEPQPGFWSITTSKKGAARPLCVVHKNGFWTVFIDGEPLRVPSPDWETAFGSHYQNGGLQGTRLDHAEYKALLLNRLNLIRRGIDSDQATNLSQMEPAI